MFPFYFPYRQPRIQIIGYIAVSVLEKIVQLLIYKLACRKYKIEVCTSFPTLRIFHRPVLLWSIADCDVYICKFNLIFYNLKMYANKPIRVCVLPDSSIRSICSLIFFRSGRGYFNMNNFTWKEFTSAAVWTYLLCPLFTLLGFYCKLRYSTTY